MIDRFRGTGTALITPFNNDNSIDFDGLQRLLNHVTDGGVDYLLVLGTTSEAPTLNHDEKNQVLNFIKSNNPNQLPIVLGMGGNNTAALVQQIKSEDLSGVDAILSVAPYYNRPGQEGLLAHFNEVADNSSVPVILYNVPARTSSNLLASTTLSLAKHENIIAIKEASGNINQCAEIAANAPDDFLLLSGEDMYTLPILSIGGAGVISVIANGLPHQFSKMVNSFLNGDTTNSAESFHSIVKMTQLIFREGNPTGIKELLNQLNICGNMVRLPLMEASDSLSKEIEAELKNLHKKKATKVAL